MQITLKVYKTQKEVEKEYSVDSYDLLWGTVEDLIETLDLDSLSRQLDPESRNNLDLISIVGTIVKNSRSLINETLKDVFEGLTDEELRRVKITNLIEVVVALAKASVDSLGLLGNSQKN